MDVYINPNLSLFNNIEDLEKEKPSPKYRWWIEKEKLTVKDLLNQSRLIVLAEPGYGKTELFKKIILEANQLDQKAIMLDLKSVDLTKKLSDNIIDQAKRPEKLKTEDFELMNSEKVIICLDALDEVSSNKTSLIIERIKDFLNDFLLTKVFISCRTLHYSKCKNDFISYRFKYVEINCFIHDQISNYLERNNINKEQDKLIFRSFLQTGRISVIQTPRYLNLLVKYIKDTGTKDFDTITRCELFEFFVYNKLNKEKNVFEKVDIELFRRVLETLALTMEIYQANKLTKEELTTFFEDIKNDLKINILSQITIDEFINKSFLKDNITEIEFDNTEFQEYLAAKEMLRLGKLEQTVFDLCVNEELREIYPSWFNVLSYVIEMKVELLEDILKFGMNVEKNIVTGYFALITNANVNSLKSTMKNEIFNKVFEYHQNNTLTIEPRICQNLSFYYTDNNSEILRKYTEKDYRNEYQEHILIRNVFHMLYEIFQRKYLKEDEISYWKQRYTSILENEKVNLNLKLQILFLTEYLKDEKILQIINDLSKNCDESDLSNILNAASNIDVNSKTTLDLIFYAINEKSSIAVYTIFEIDSIDLIKDLFRSLNNNELLLQNFHEITTHIYHEKSLQEFISKLERKADKELLNLIKEFIVKSYKTHNYWAQYSKVLKGIIEFISKIDNNLLFELIDRFSTEKDIYHFELVDIFTRCIHVNQIAHFVEEIKNKFPSEEYIAFQSLYSTRLSKNKDAMDIFNLGKKYFEKEYEQAEKNQKEREREEKKETDRDYMTFRELLNISNEKEYMLNIFDYYANSNELIEKNITEEERKKLITLVN